MVTLRFTIGTQSTVRLFLGDTDWSIFNDSAIELRVGDSEGKTPTEYQPLHAYSSIDATMYRNRKPKYIYNPDGSNSANVSVMIEEPSGGLDL